MPKHQDLRPNQTLLNPTFEKYQFSSEFIPIDEEKALPIGTLRIDPLPQQDSWLETQIFAFHNHLFQNPFDLSSWFYDQNFQIFQLKQDKTFNLIYSFNTQPHTHPPFNPTISFASNHIVVFTAINNDLILMITSPTHNNTHTFKSLQLPETQQDGFLLDSRYVTEKSLLIIIMCYIIEENQTKKSKLVILYYSLSITEDQHPQYIHHFIQKQDTIVNGPIQYLYIESNGNFIHLLSQEMAQFTTIHLHSKENPNYHQPIPKYFWTQDRDSLTVWLPIPIQYQGVKPDIHISSTNILITINNDIIIQGDFRFLIDYKASVWHLQQDNTLKIKLIKHESGQMWDQFIVNDIVYGEYLPNEHLAAEIHSRLSHLCADQHQHHHHHHEQSILGFNSEQLEECDLEDKDHTLQRIHLNNQTTTHVAIFGSHNRVLFGFKSTSSQILCSRYDHDACIWQLNDTLSSDHWPITHMATFPGFGYVEASKTNRKFSLLPPNFSYIAIIEHTKYALIYERPQQNQTIAKQKIIDLGSDTEPILGAVATDENIILLTKQKLYSFKLI